MFNQLDKVLTKLLDHAPPIVGLNDSLFGSAEISFITPERHFSQSQDLAINLFLYEVKENRELRQAMPDRKNELNRGATKRAPLRVDCSYMVTAWSKKTGEQKIQEEHQLLGEAFNWLSRFPVIPDQYVQAGGLTLQLYAPPTMVAQMDGAKSAGEFWHALGIPPRPYFNLIVTICMDLDQSVDDSIVNTVSSSYQTSTAARNDADEWIMIGGTVRKSNGDPVVDAWVRLESLNPQISNQIQVTDRAGHFIFDRVARGTGYTLRARARGLPEVSVPDLEVPSLTGAYDIVV